MQNRSIASLRVHHTGARGPHVQFCTCEILVVVLYCGGKAEWLSQCFEIASGNPGMMTSSRGN